MKKILVDIALMVLFASLMPSCQKEIPCINCPTQSGNGNKTPFASAGPDQATTTYIDSVLLSGAGSYDPDGTIAYFEWTKISGPSCIIVTPSANQTVVKNLVQGIYQLQLQVKDNSGLTARDTVSITVLSPPILNVCDTSRPRISAQLIPIGTLSIARQEIALAVAGNKILFAGGYLNTNGAPCSRVDIFNTATQTWSTKELSQARYEMGTASSGNKAFFAGGQHDFMAGPSDVIDMYDAATDTWTTGHLSLPGWNVVGAAAGDKVLFAGGSDGVLARFKRVDIYTISTNTWSIDSLSEEKDAHTAVVMNNKIYFAGGLTGYQTNTIHPSSKVDIYDVTTATWSSTTMQIPRNDFASVVVNNKIYWASGETSMSVTGSSFTCSVEIKDILTGNTTMQNLLSPTAWHGSDQSQNAVVRNGKIIFLHQGINPINLFDIYDIATNTWSIGVLPFKIANGSIISLNNVIYIAGPEINGQLSNKVYVLDF